MIAVLTEHAAVAAEFQAEIRKLPDLERLLAKAVSLLTRLQTCAFPCQFRASCTWYVCHNRLAGGFTSPCSSFNRAKKSC